MRIDPIPFPATAEPTHPMPPARGLEDPKQGVRATDLGLAYDHDFTPELPIRCPSCRAECLAWWQANATTIVCDRCSGFGLGA